MHIQIKLEYTSTAGYARMHSMVSSPIPPVLQDFFFLERELFTCGA